MEARHRLHGGALLRELANGRDHDPAHRWLKEGMSKDQLQKIQDFYKQRYGEQNEPK